MQDYKHTLNLPKTEFAMKANLPQREPEMLKHWETINVYEKLRASRKGAEKFILHDGPPYANGHLHIGHALNKALKDFIVKSKTLDGYDAPYVPGWDCHGLPIEHHVEKKVGKPGVKIDVKAFREKCREYANSQVNIQREEFKRIGVLGDWNNPYLTMDSQYEANIIRSLARIIANGHIQRGFKPVYWCLDCCSALAEAEVEYKDKTSPSIDVIFEAVESEKFLKILNVSKSIHKIGVPIWTTTPWTLPANQAVSLHPSLDYALVEFDHSGQQYYLLLAFDLVERVMQRYGVEHYEVLSQCQGNLFENILLQHPFYERKVPIILGEHVTVDAGTGAVHTAPAHGIDDYRMGQAYELPVNNPVNPHGVYLEDVPLFAGQHILKANQAIIQLLKDNHRLINSGEIEHSYPHCWRHKTPIIFRATPQWFISMDKNNLRKEALATINKTQWIPQWGENRIFSMIVQRPDWCISRQRTWGVPLALFIHKRTGELHPKTLELMDAVAKQVEVNGIDAWYALDLKALLGKDEKDYEQSHDTLDVWFDSGVSHACVLEQNKQLNVPADIYLEGSDQHRGWFNSSLMTAVAMRGQSPFRQVLTHGYTVDAQGRKMSKSLGNVIGIEKMAKTYGADILRLWVAATDYTSEITFSDEIFKRNADAYRRIRNTARFLLANLNDFDPTNDLVEPSAMLLLDRWAVDRAYGLQKEIQQAFKDYAFHIFYQKIHNFCSQDMGSFYLDVIKDRQYTCQKESVARRSAQTAMYHIIEAMVRWLAPIISFTADEIWQSIPGQRSESVFLTTWYEKLFAIEKETLINREEWSKIMVVRDAVNKALEEKRKEGLIRSPLSADVTLFCEQDLMLLLAKLKDELRFVLITSSAKLEGVDSRSDNAFKTDVNGLWLQAQPSTHEKCVRCWHQRADVGTDEKHPNLCVRCVLNVDGEGEVRLFA